MKIKNLIILPLLIIFFLVSCKFGKNNEKENILNSATKQKIEMKNPVSYFEIPVQDIERAIKFYNSVFGFEFEKNNIDGNEMAFFPQSENEKGISGALAKGKTYKPSTIGTLIYFDTENIDQVLVKVEESGGKTLYPKTSIGELGFVAEFEDCEGNKIGIHQNKK
jgi:uncharacterized protein